jgi:hypothetical protein
MRRYIKQDRAYPKDTGLQQILWRVSSDTLIQACEFQVATYGTLLACYLTTACMKKLTEEKREKYPQATMVLSQDFDMDDVLCRSNDVTEALKLQADLITLLASAGFPLRNGCFDHSRILDAAPT